MAACFTWLPTGEASGGWDHSVIEAISIPLVDSKEISLKFRFLFGAGMLCLFLLAACEVNLTPLPVSPSPSLENPTLNPSSTIQGTVMSEEGLPLPGATVRIQATVNQTFSDDQGGFMLSGLEPGVQVTLSAWADGYYCAKAEAITPPASGIMFSMRLVQTGDNPDYQWIAPTGENSCYSCKPGVTQVWLDNDAHGKSASNPRFLNMYNGTDLDGNQSPLTRFAYSRDYGYFPLQPDPSLPYYGPGYKLDFPNTNGNCSTCHIPGAAVDAPYTTDPNKVTGVNAYGIHCDYCHKVADVILDPGTSLPYPNMPGVLSQDIRRPFTDDTDRYQLFFGSFDDDNVPEEDTYLPLIKQSAWCAPCHYGVFWDTLIYNSYGEWLQSPYSHEATGKTCQQCHMPAPTLLNGEPIANIAPKSVGVERDPLTIPAHTFPGAASEALLQNALTMTVLAQREADQITVSVTLLNDLTGHHVPTDSPLRQLILLVNAQDEDGKALVQVSGPTVPDWGGVGDPQQGYYAGLPGWGYARILAELWTDISPSGAYWNPTRVVSDNRLPAFGSDTTTYLFAISSPNSASVQVSLIYRRAFIELMDQKGWDVPDIIMEQVEITVPGR
jgi:hypothetical protein